MPSASLFRKSLVFLTCQQKLLVKTLREVIKKPDFVVTGNIGMKLILLWMGECSVVPSEGFDDPISTPI